MTVRWIFEKNYYAEKIYFIIRMVIYIVLLFPVEWIKQNYRKYIIKDSYQIKKYKNIYCNKRIFIIATGPSLELKDYQMLKDEITIGVNALCLWFSKEKQKTTHFVISDQAAYNKLEENLPSECFVSDRLKSKKHFQKFPVLLLNQFILIDFWKKISLDLVKGSYDFHSVVMHAIQIALYMGSKEIYLLGVDCNYNKSNCYSIDHGIRDKYQKNVGKLMINDFEILKKFSEKRGIKIYNASPHSMLGIFPKITLENIIDKGNSHCN